MTDMYVHAEGDKASRGAAGDTPSAASATMDTAAHEASDLRERAGEEVGTVVDTAKEQAISLVDQAKGRFKEEAGNATSRAATAIKDTGGELTSMAAKADNPGPAARIVRQAGQRVEQLGERLNMEGYEGVARDVSRWARQNPGLFLLGAASAGFVIGRVFRSVDTKSVAEVVRGNGSASSSLDDQSYPGMYQSPALATGMDPVGIDAMTPPVDAPPMYAPQPHPDASVPVVDLTDPVGQPSPQPTDPGLAGGGPR